MSDSPTTLTIQGSGGVDLVCDSWGNRGKRPVIMLHGGGQTRQAWGNTAHALAARGHHVLAVDQRGHGDSGRPVDADYEIDHFAADLLELVGQFDEPPVVVGASLGGLTAITAQRDLGEQLYSGLVLVDITPRMEMAGVRRIVDFMTAHPDGFADLDDAAAAIAAYMPQREKRSDSSGLSRVLRQTPDGRWRWHWDVRFITSRVDRIADSDYGSYLDRFRHELLAAATKIRIPTLLVRGNRSDVVSEDGVRELLGAIPHAEYVDVAGATHMVAGDQNDAFTDVVVAFLDTIP